jgi:hypothetical protein
MFAKRVSLPPGNEVCLSHPGTEFSSPTTSIPHHHHVKGISEKETMTSLPSGGSWLSSLKPGSLWPLTPEEERQ